MRISQFVSLYLLFACVCSENIIIQFLKDFFAEKTVMITASLCWGDDDLKQLLWAMKADGSKHPKQVAIFNKNADTSHFSRHLSTDNFFVFDVRSCNSSYGLLMRINETNLFRFPLKYLLIADASIYDKLITDLENSTVYPSSDVVVAINSPNKEIILHQYYRVGEGRELLTENYGRWSVTTGLEEYYKHRGQGTRRKNVQKVLIRVTLTMTNNDTWNHLTDYRYPRIDTFTKQDYPIYDNFLQYINASWVLNGTPSFGYYNETSGQYDGCVEEVYRRRSHLVGNSIYMTEKRFDVMDFFALIINPIEFKFVVRKPSTSYIKNIFIMTFRWNVWVSIAVVLFIFAVAMWYLLNLEYKYKGSERPNMQTTFSASDVGLISLEALCQQGTPTVTRSASGRIAFLILFTSFMAIYVAYSAHIVVLLQSTTKINTLRELLESRITVVGENQPFVKGYFAAPKTGILREIYEKKILPGTYYDLAEGMEKVREGNLAFHVRLLAAYDYALEKFSSYDICGLQELPGYMEDYKGFVGFQKNLIYREIFKVGFLKLSENGLTKRSVLKVLVKPQCYMRTASFQNVGFYDSYEIFIIWAVGVCVAVNIFILENIIARISIEYSTKE